MDSSLTRSRILVAVVLLSSILGWWKWSQPTLDELVIQARTAIDQQNESRAVAVTAEILRRDARHPEGLLLSAVVAAETGAFESAIDLCQQVSAEAPATFSDAQLMAGSLSLDQLGKVSAAESFFRNVLEKNPDHLTANQRMVYVLSLQARAWDLIPFQIHVLQQSTQAATQIQFLMQGELAYPDAELISRLRVSDPSCAGLLLAEAQRASLAGDDTRAEDSCRRAIALDNNLAEAHAKLGRILLQTGSDLTCRKWQAGLPPTALKHPHVLYALGQLARRRNQTPQAARCFWESLRIDPNFVAANHQLGQSLVALNRESDAKSFLERASRLEHYESLLEVTGVTSPEVSNDSAVFSRFLEQSHNSMQLAESLGLTWEAYAWSLIAAQAPSPPPWSRESVQRLRLLLAELPKQRCDPKFNPANAIDLTEFPFPVFSQAEISNGDSASGNMSDVPFRVSFSEDSRSVGLTFQYHNGQPAPRHIQIRPYDFTGGGVGVLDLDHDGWPDLCFPQGTHLGNGAAFSDIRQGQDGLFLNRRGERLTPVDDVALPTAVDYSQGLSIGDDNSDGFADLVIANLGRNRLLRNNGDGTFSDDSAAIAADSAAWTTSCLICDLNNDQHPDLYFVNYLSGDILTRLCSDGEQRFGGCSPRDFPAAPDQLLLNQGDGSFLDVSAAAGIDRPDGKGLGIIAADFNGDHSIDLFIANDGVPNFLFENVTAPDSDVPRFTESAVTRGVAVNGEGQSEACMGAIFDDLDGNGLPDLFVTNFLDETNTLYAGTSHAGSFEDVTRQSGSSLSSRRLLGFGTQTIDADLDGTLEIVIANGHVDSYRTPDVPYRMRPQYFRNLGGLQFEETPATTTGPYFDGEYLGRGVARLDWNRDGADDLVITHLDQPVALLTNTTPARGHSLGISLIARYGSRDAVGSVVTVTTPAGSTVRQLSAGDGYEASNERRLTFGLGNATSVDQLQVIWPGGHVDTYSNLDINSDWLLLERGIVPLRRPY